jgi:hypothetical protein
MFRRGIDMICARQRGLRVMLRIGAALSLLFWVSALATCSTECLCSDEHSESENIDLAHNSHSHDSGKEDHHAGSFCDSLHSTCLPSTTVESVKPDFRVFTLNLLAAAPAIEIFCMEAPSSRQPPDAKWVFTPEVCLGPAFRSLAPPFPYLV